MVDPWAYRARLTMPKLIVNATNDFYWATDALNLYWDGIPNDKWVLYLPNAGHNLRRQDRPPSEQLNDLITGLAAFTRHQINGTAMPSLRWRHENADGKLRLIIDATPVAAELHRDYGSPDHLAAISARPNGGRKLCALQTAGSSAKSRARTKAVWPFSASWNTKSTA